MKNAGELVGLAALGLCREGNILRPVALCSPFSDVMGEPQSDSQRPTMPARRERLAVKIFRIIEGEAEGPFAISVFLIIVLTAIAVAAWRFQQ